MSETAEGSVTDEGEPEEDESGEQPGLARAEGAQTGERRPRRRGRRGGRRRRGGPDDGLAGSIADELAPPPAAEAESAAADFDSVSAPSASIVEPEAVAAPSSPAPQPAEPMRPETVAASQEETAAEAERTARRRSTVREKVSFLTSPPPDTAPAIHAAPERTPAPAPAEAAPASEGDQPRKAGWWSRRFGNSQ